TRLQLDPSAQTPCASRTFTPRPSSLPAESPLAANTRTPGAPAAAMPARTAAPFMTDRRVGRDMMDRSVDSLIAPSITYCCRRLRPAADRTAQTPLLWRVWLAKARTSESC